MNCISHLPQSIGSRETGIYCHLLICCDDHLSQSTDTMAGHWTLREFYGKQPDQENPFNGAYSEHSTVTSWGRENEADAHRHNIHKFLGSELSLNTRTFLDTALV